MPGAVLQVRGLFLQKGHIHKPHLINSPNTALRVHHNGGGQGGVTPAPLLAWDKGGGNKGEIGCSRARLKAHAGFRMERRKSPAAPSLSCHLCHSLSELCPCQHLEVLQLWSKLSSAPGHCKAGFKPSCFQLTPQLLRLGYHLNKTP